jgi:hypothetical protein
MSVAKLSLLNFMAECETSVYLYIGSDTREVVRVKREIKSIKNLIIYDKIFKTKYKRPALRSTGLFLSLLQARYQSAPSWRCFG